MPAPFLVRSFRYQWPADLLTSWAFEMETLILGWYVLVETKSVFHLTVFGALQFIGTLLSPALGMLGDRIGVRTVLAGMRAIYTILAMILMALAYSGQITPTLVFIVAALSGLVRPTDMGMRSAVVGDSMPPEHLTSAMGINRTTSDSARIAGALTGAGVFALLGMAPAYLVVATFYALGFALTLIAAAAAAAAAAPAESAEHAVPQRVSPWRDLSEGLVYVWNTPHLLAGMWLAFLVNLCAFPISGGLLPYVARDVFHVDQTGLGYLTASFASGAFFGSIMLSSFGARLPPGRTMLVAAAIWYGWLIVFAQMTMPLPGAVLLFLAGFAQSMSMVPLVVMLLRTSQMRLRGRVMGVRMLAIYSLPLGLLLAGWTIPQFGFHVTATCYALFGLVCTLLIGIYWRRDLWDRQAKANAL